MRQKVYGKHLECSYDGSAMMQKGVVAEDAFLAWSRTRTREPWELLDVRDDKRAQRLKLDFVMKRADDPRRQVGIDVKSSSVIGTDAGGGKVLVEVERVYHNPNGYGYPTDGWLLKSKARFLFYYNPVTHLLWVFRMADLRAYYEAHLADYPQDRWIEIASDKRKTTYCVLLPLSAFDYHVVDLAQ